MQLGFNRHGYCESLYQSSGVNFYFIQTAHHLSSIRGFADSSVLDMLEIGLLLHQIPRIFHTVSHLWNSWSLRPPLVSVCDTTPPTIWSRITLHALSFSSPVVTICTTRFNIQQFYILPTQCICVLCGSENKQRLYPYTILTDWFL